MTSTEIFAQERTEGPWIQGRRGEYRYVTIYEIEKVKRPLGNFPWIEEDCHDMGNRFANWSRSISYEIAYGGNLTFSLLGFMEIDLGADRTRTIEFTFQRWVTPTEGIRARHRLHEEYEMWKGHTIIEYNNDGLIEVGTKKYPFSLSKINYGISVEREILEICD